MAVDKRTLVFVSVALGGLALGWKLWSKAVESTSSEAMSSVQVRESSSLTETQSKETLSRPRSPATASLAVPMAERLARFQAISSRPWSVTPDAFRGGVKTLSGGRIELSGPSVAERAQDFVSRFSRDLFQLDPAQMKQKSFQMAARKKVVYQQFVGDLPVYGAQLALVFENEQLSRIQSDLVPNGRPVQGNPVSVQALSAWFQKNRPNDRLIMDPDWAPRLSLLPAGDSFAVIYVTSVDEFQSASQKTIRKTFLIDAKSLQILRVINKTKT